MYTQEETEAKILRAQAGEDDAKMELIEGNMPLIKSIVRRYKNKQIEYEDLIQLGTLGLIKAINNFDVSFGVRFSTYAVPMIAGEIKRFIRDDGAIKVSRSVKAQSMAINKYIDAFRNENSRTPTLEELSKEFNLEPSELVFITESSRYPVSIYAENDEDGLTLADKIADKTDPDEVLDKLLLKEIILKLPERDRKIIILRYFRDKTQSDVAALLGVSQVQVSRLEAKILTLMRELLS